MVTMRTQHYRLKLIQYLWSSFTLMCLLTAFVTGAYRLPDDEVRALKDIATALKKTSWHFNVDPCSGTAPWVVSQPDDAVICNCSYSSDTVCHVTSISLKRQGLQGTLPPDFVRLPYLQNLDLTLNYLNGTIPSEWGSMANIQNISLLGNRLTGRIPKEIGKISTLQSFVVEFNQLYGELPEELGNLSRLQRLLLTSNNFTGKLPSTFAKLTALTDVWLGDNQFEGTIPEFIQNWTNVDTLVFAASGFLGPIPSGIGALQNLTDLRITDLSGTESHFPQLSNRSMEILVLRNCNLVGNLPDYLANFASLKTLDVSFNYLTGEIPTNSSGLSTVDYLYLTGNLFTGLIPHWIMNSGTSKKRDLSYNNFTKEEALCTKSNGNVNLFASSSEVNSSESVSCLGVHNCPAKGLKNLSINCGGSEVTIGSISYNSDKEQGGAAHYYNGEGYYWAYSSTGHFMDNKTSEPYIVSNTSTLSMGTPKIYMNARVSPISLTYYGFCLINGTYNVSLHFAEIMFTGDQNYSSLGRRYFDVYIQGKLELKDFNIEDAAGGVGKPIIKSFITTVTGGTLQIRFQWAGRGTTAIPNKGVYGPLISAITAATTDRGSKLSVGEVFGIVAGIAVFIFLIIFILWRKGCLGQNSGSARGFEGLQLQTGSFTLRQIKVATNNFSDANKIGEGGFGPVHKGVLPDGRIIAVKQLSSKSKQGNREFLNEIGMISALQHPNLVKLYGCCIEQNQLLLVYEYLENNSLARALFGSQEHQLNLDWRTRHMICVGLARGLAFLHEESRLKVVHRDIKATNVLLDRNLNPKISDFGLAKLDDEDNTHISTRIAGTYGYMAPEYAMHGYLTEKADVYSFGIVALEIVSGRSNTSYKSKGECLYLLSWAQALKERGTLMDLIDPRLGSEFNKDEVMVVIEVALLCTNISPSVRPTMSSVVRMLAGDEAIPAIVPDSSVSNDDAKLEAMRRHFMGSEEEEEEPGERSIESIESDVPLTTASTSSKDLYPAIWNSEYWQRRI